ncbi:coproporphyrinogen dehydrogenase HemZ [Peptoanaerobacter stomatis]|uniref:Coproporphyrinogen dehydrogenase HemZ n=1 Tax=Peptoanaerobacter stomatis TaxID=796937 RepID=J5WDG9_9FIRM|nr:coproporphyrinogen dehydrogenase HemZ [Peptoanaerobacter stomatis]EJU21112.1 coproporphyrinogen dehydrogenase HemZ [Peptoanaerobacter stomatis]NWO26002.1 coproporphyrinogen dehydrogenase HemZ [Peptostreptococcaceae bacterium oral taxon 081]
MLIISDNEKYDIELKELANMLFARRKKIYLKNEIDADNETEIISLKKKDDEITATLSQKEIEISTLKSDINFKEKLIYKKLLYLIIKNNYTDVTGKWGILTGIRPVKIVNDLKKENKTDIQIYDILKNNYLLSDEKIKLIKGISDVQEEIIDILSDDISIYISIPFCPSRCNYCSFFSIDINSGKKYIKDYLKNLEIEIRETLKLPYFKDKNISSIYVGGGTPSSLDETELKIFFDIINYNFDLNKIKEFTFEAGRVDTLTREKLKIIKSNNVSRISINPQTMNDDTLIKIGRKHNVEDVKNTYEIARELGFDNINMDLILGLADENISDMDKSVDEIIKLDPDSITVHCLAIKRASDINTKNIKATNIEISDYMQKLTDKLNGKNYMPYYLYRQKNMLENGENIGFCKENKYSLYNVAMMDELQSIIGFGVGSASKILNKNTNLLRRIPNYKDVILYNNNIKEIIKRKEDI